MRAKQFIDSTIRIIQTHQVTQQNFPPSSPQWKKASSEINRLSLLVVEAQNEACSCTWEDGDDRNCVLHGVRQ
jgi:hypothetical protein